LMECVHKEARGVVPAVDSIASCNAMLIISLWSVWGGWAP